MPRSARPTVAVLGATGFVGGAVAAALRARGAVVLGISAPRLAPVGADELDWRLRSSGEAIESLTGRFDGCDVVVNAAGRSEAGSSDLPGLLAANALLPGVIARAAEAAGVPRLVHLSSGAVQGDAAVLDASGRVRPFSPYSYSKARGEQLALGHHPGVVVYRPAGVQGVTRPATENLVRLARSSLALAAGRGAGNSPQALVDNVADAAAFLALSDEAPPAIVHHPSEGITTGELLELLRDRPPQRVPAWLPRTVTRTLLAAGHVAPSLAARRRRLEVLWFGQDQAPSWLTDAGWQPPVGRNGWRDLGQALAPR